MRSLRSLRLTFYSSANSSFGISTERKLLLFHCQVSHILQELVDEDVREETKNCPMWPAIVFSTSSICHSVKFLPPDSQDRRSRKC